MRWEGERQSENVEDRRGHASGGGGLPRLGGGRVGGRGLGLGTIVIAVLAAWVFGINPLAVLGVLGGGGDLGSLSAPQQQQQAPAQTGAKPQDRQAAFVSTVLANTEDVWGQIFQASGASYKQPRLVLFRGATRTACGQGQAAMGPFYCPLDETVYIDLGFFDNLHQQLGAPGDFAQAYVVAHEVAHHVQRLMGVMDKVDAARGRLSVQQNNALSVRVELQADCLAGVWAHHSQRAKGWLEAGDIEEGLNAASRIGDDTLQRQSQGTIVPASFTHGSSAQRVAWFRRGLEGGQVAACNTFEARQL
jgi:uncharacterized protein